MPPEGAPKQPPIGHYSFNFRANTVMSVRSGSKCQTALSCAHQRRLPSDGGQDPPDEPRCNRPACAREEAHAEPHADLVEVDGGRHVKFSLCIRSTEKQKSPTSAVLLNLPTIPRTAAKISLLWTTPRTSPSRPYNFCSTNFSASKTGPDRSNNSCASYAIFSSGLSRYPNFSKPLAYIARKNSPLHNMDHFMKV
jgi:hypothetical protein